MKMKKIRQKFKPVKSSLSLKSGGPERERFACRAFGRTLKTISRETFFALSRSMRAGRERSGRLSVRGFSIVMCAVLLTFACTPRSFEKPNVAIPSPSTAEDKQASFQNELEKMKTANLQYIFVFRRKDGGAVDGEDKRFLRASLPFNTRVVLADEDKAVIVGSNFKFPPENTDALRMRFNVEDHSTAEQPK